MSQSNEPTSRKPIRLWPGVIAAALLLLPSVFPEAAIYGMIGGFASALVIVLWWLFFSRAPWAERLGAIVLMFVALFTTSLLVHESISNGMMGMMLPVLAIPVLSVALVAAVAAS